LGDFSHITINIWDVEAKYSNTQNRSGGRVMIPERPDFFILLRIGAGIFSAPLTDDAFAIGEANKLIRLG